MGAAPFAPPTPAPMSPQGTHAATPVTLMGWVNRRRDHGDLIFFDLRDRSGITQVVFDKSISPEAHAKAEQARPEFVVAVTGTVRLREPGMANPKMATGDIELVGRDLLLLNDAKTPPFSPAEDAIKDEEVRLKYRYIDLRRPEMQHNFLLRSKVAMAIRNYLVEGGFLEIETPFMTRSTPEGARDYLVPSRVHPGHFYALPQSPQIFKQILMISGFDRYFQIARCFRDEDLRADRQPEFTQIDLEMTFPQQETVFAVAEGFLHAAFRAAGVELPPEPFVRMTYDQAIERYGIDKPDMRLPAMVNLSQVLTPELRETLKIDPALPVYGFTVPKAAAGMSGTQKRSLVDEIRKILGDTGLDFLDVARLRTNEAFTRSPKPSPPNSPPNNSSGPLPCHPAAKLCHPEAKRRDLHRQPSPQTSPRTTSPSSSPPNPAPPPPGATTATGFLSASASSASN